MGMSRRTFLETTLAAGAAIVAAPLRRLFAAQAAPAASNAPAPASAPAPATAPGASAATAAGSSTIIEVEGKDVRKMVAAVFAGLGGIERFVKRGDSVVLKPNFSFANPPEWGSGTHPETIIAVAEACLAAGAKSVTVVEFPLSKLDKCLKRTGVAAAMKRLPAAKLQILGAAEDFQTTAIPGGVSCTSAEIAKVVLAANVFINLPAAKHHSAAGVSFGLKNAMGLIRDRGAFHGPIDLHQGIADLARVVRPHLTILDATRALLTNGPAGPGESATPGKLVAGTDMVAVDAYGLTLARFGGKAMTLADAPHIALAAKAGLGEADVSKIVVKKARA